MVETFPSPFTFDFKEQLTLIIMIIHDDDDDDSVLRIIITVLIVQINETYV